MNTVTKSMKQLTLTGRPVPKKAAQVRQTFSPAGRWWTSEEVPAELMYDDFIYPEDLEMECFESDPTNFDSLEPMDPKLWQEELMRREEWFKHWHKPDTRTSKISKRRSPRDLREQRARRQAYGHSSV